MFSSSRILDRYFGGNDRSSNVRRNIIGSVLIKVLSILISFFIVPLTLSFVDKELYGIWLILSSIVLWINFFDIGFTTGLRNKLTESIALNDYFKARNLVSSTYVVLSVIFIPLMVLSFLIIPLVDWCGFLNIQDKYRDDVILTMYPLVASFCLQMILNVVTTVLIAYQKTALSSLFGVIANFLSLVIILILPYITKPSLFALSMAISTTSIAVLLFASLWLYGRQYKELRPSVKLANFTMAKDVFTLGGKFFILQLYGTVLYYTTNVLISNVSSPIDVSVYNIAYKYLSSIMMFFSILLGPLWPAFTDAYVKNDFSWMRKIYRKMSMLCILMTLALIVMTVISPLVYKLWIGDKLYISFSMTIVVAMYIASLSWKQLQDTLINGIGKIKLSVYVSCLGLLIYIPMALLFGRYYGALGVVLSMTILNLVGFFVFSFQLNQLIDNKATGVFNK